MTGLRTACFRWEFLYAEKQNPSPVLKAVYSGRWRGQKRPGEAKVLTGPFPWGAAMDYLQHPHPSSWSASSPRGGKN
ncbi:hypothetical protein CLOSTMETH_03538 [[Clostridium] methylpentosum DSM 5476]|uniref:Uncharacterized protein n=1 Tax=[Clostridium] methylpentosum DSM 5476 TaxID=537013 RepID=C0EI43_9FIRM|nr:hypothetical protein CLOSTMETH_03538 [[Clostridium] methylpentosum DSM 5476]